MDPAYHTLGLGAGYVKSWEQQDQTASYAIVNAQSSFVFEL